MTTKKIFQLSVTPLLALASLQLSAQITAEQGQLFANNCLQCHAYAHVGAPMVGNAEHWRERNKKGLDQLVINTIEGIDKMPPLGNCSACSEADFRAIIRMMAGLPAPATKEGGLKGAEKTGGNNEQ